jgi:hypothetical protein
VKRNNNAEPGSKAEMIRRLRLGDLKKILRWRYHHTLADDDAGRADLELLLDCVSFVPNARYRMKNVIEVWAPWMDTAESYELVEHVLSKPDYLRKLKADQLGEKLNLTYEERQRLRIRTIAPADLSQEEFAERRKSQRRVKKRESQQRRRRKAGAKSHATSLSRLKPWKAKGISRATWYRKRAKPGETDRETEMKPHKLLDRKASKLSHSVLVESREGLPRKRVAAGG